MSSYVLSSRRLAAQLHNILVFLFQEKYKNFNGRIIEDEAVDDDLVNPDSMYIS